MVVKSKYTGLILVICTILLFATVIGYRIKLSDYKQVNAKVIMVGDRNNLHGSEVEYYVVLEYEYQHNLIQGELYVSSPSKYKVNDTVQVKINPKKPSEIEDGSLYKYLLPFLIIIMIFDFLFLFGKRRNA